MRTNTHSNRLFREDNADAYYSQVMRGDVDVFAELEKVNPGGVKEDGPVLWRAILAGPKITADLFSRRFN